MADSTMSTSSTDDITTPSFTSQLLEDIEEYSSALAPSSSLYMYTYEQEKVLFWAGKITTVIGMLGSAYVCYCISKDPVRRKQTFRRLLFCTSFGHIILCILMALSSIPMPSGTHYAAYGNEQSCQAMGFLTHVAFGYTLFYHGAMGAYYGFTFFLGWTERKFHETVEPILHCIAIGAPLLGAIIGIATGMYGPNELLLSCWVTTGAPHRVVFIFLSGLIELNYFTFFKQVSLIGIAYTVYKQERRMVSRYSLGGAHNTPPQSVLMARETLIQASIFFLGCFIPYALMMVMRYFDCFWKNIPEDGKVPHYLFGLAVAAQVLYPLQGFFTMIGFVRPDYRKIKKEMMQDYYLDEEDGSSSGTCCHFWQCLKAAIWYQLQADSTPAAAVAASTRKSQVSTTSRRTSNMEGSSGRMEGSSRRSIFSILSRREPPAEVHAFSGTAEEESHDSCCHCNASSVQFTSSGVVEDALDEATLEDASSSEDRSPSPEVSSSPSGPSRSERRVSFAALSEEEGGPVIIPIESIHDDDGDGDDDVYDEENVETSVRV